MKLSLPNVVRAVAAISTGTVLAQAVAFATVPLIAVFFGPEDVGAMAIFTSVVTFCVPLVSLSLPLAVQIPASDEQAQGIAWLSLALSWVAALILTVITTAILLLGVPMGQLQTLGWALCLAPIAAASIGTGSVWEALLLRKSLFSASATLIFFVSVVQNAPKLLVGIWPGAASLVVATSIGMLATGAISTVFAATRGVKLKLSRPQNPLRTLRSIKEFPLFRAPQEALNAASHGVPVVLLSVMYGLEAAGAYTIARMVLQIPVALFSRSVMKVLYPELARLRHDGGTPFSVIVRYTAWMAVPAIAPSLILVLTGPELFSLFLGDEWRSSGEMARWLSFWLFFWFINAPASSAIPLLGLQQTYLIYEVASITMRMLAIFASFLMFDDAIASVAAFSVVSGTLNAALIIGVILRSRSGFSPHLEKSFATA